MMISFGETFNRVRECFQEQSVIDSLVPKLASVTIIRDVNGRIRLFLEPSEPNTIQTSEITNLATLLSAKLGNYDGNDIWLPAGEKDAYKALIQTIEAVVDTQGRVSLREKVKFGKMRRALLTILDDEIVENKESMVGSIEIIDDDLESGSREIANLFNQSLKRTGENL